MFQISDIPLDYFWVLLSLFQMLSYCTQCVASITILVEQSDAVLIIDYDYFDMERILISYQYLLIIFYREA